MTSATGSGSALGFTLLEVLIVIAIVALVSVAVPMALPHLVPAQQLRADSESLAGVLRGVRAETAGQSETITLQIDASEGRVGGEYRKPLWRASHGVSVTWHPYGNSPNLRFFPDGSSSGGSILLGQGARQMRVEVTPMTGRIQVTAP